MEGGEKRRVVGEWKEEVEKGSAYLLGQPLCAAIRNQRHALMDVRRLKSSPRQVHNGHADDGDDTTRPWYRERSLLPNKRNMYDLIYELVYDTMNVIFYVNTL